MKDREFEAIVTRSAWVSNDGKYRYNLVRNWDSGRARVLFVMLNPSTADASVDDPTIRRCIGFARCWGFGSLEVVNLSPIRSTNPDALFRARTTIDIHAHHTNRFEIINAWNRAGLVIFAWGSHKAASGMEEVAREWGEGGKVRVLGTTKNGSPRHPLYVRRDAVPVEWK